VSTSFSRKKECCCSVAIGTACGGGVGKGERTPPKRGSRMQNTFRLPFTTTAQKKKKREMKKASTEHLFGRRKERVERNQNKQKTQEVTKQPTVLPSYSCFS
jgi:hypothetical protein